MDKKLKQFIKENGINYSIVWKYLNKVNGRSKKEETLFKLYKAGFDIRPFVFGKDYEEEL